MEVKDYNESKAAGYVTIFPMDEDIFTIETKRFSSSTGKPAPSNVDQVSLKQIQSEIEVYRNLITNAEALVADLKAAKEA